MAVFRPVEYVWHRCICAATRFSVSTERKSFRSFIGIGPRQAVLRVEKIQMNKPENDENHSDEIFELVLKWRNVGRTSATVNRVGIGNTIAAAPPHVPMYRFFEGTTVNSVVEGGEDYVF